MKMQEVRDIAKTMSIKTSRLSKLNLIREIQTAEGNLACFATAAAGDCDQVNCTWRKDCLALAKKQVAVEGVQNSVSG